MNFDTEGGYELHQECKYRECDEWNRTNVLLLEFASQVALRGREDQHAIELKGSHRGTALP